MTRRINTVCSIQLALILAVALAALVVLTFWETIGGLVAAYVGPAMVAAGIDVRRKSGHRIHVNQETRESYLDVPRGAA